jgi:hypothetical protein
VPELSVVKSSNDQRVVASSAAVLISRSGNHKRKRKIVKNSSIDKFQWNDIFALLAKL